MINVDKNGWVNSPIVIKKQRSNIEHGPISAINAIVLHRTHTVNASTVLNAWKTQKEGAHFLISENGKVYQTASLKKKCWHVGKIHAKCRIFESCSDKDAKEINKILHKKNTAWGKKFTLVTKHELKKTYPDRFPHNHDSLGIEIVGVLSKEKEIYEIPNQSQLAALFWLLDELISKYGFTIKDIYAHGKIAHKDPKKSEGAASLGAYYIYDSLKIYYLYLQGTGQL